MADSEISSQKTWVERMLAPIADVRRGEAASALLMTLLMFLMLGAYYMLKTAREVFILTEGGAEVKSYSSAGQAILLLALVPAYGAFASRVNRGRLVTWVTLFFASNLVLFILAAQRRSAHRHRLLPLGRHLQRDGDRAVLGVRQRLYTPEQGKRLFPLIGVGSSLGAWVGLDAGRRSHHRQRPDAVVDRRRRDPRDLRADRAAWSTRVAHGRRRQAKAAEAETARQGGRICADSQRSLSDADCGDDRLLNVVNTSGEYLFGRYVVEQATHCTALARKQRRRASASSAKSTAGFSAPSTSSVFCCRCSSCHACSSSSASAERSSSTRSSPLSAT